MLLFLLIAGLVWTISNAFVEFTVLYQVILVFGVFGVVKLVLSSIYKSKGWIPIPGGDALYLGETPKSPCNVLAFYFLNNGDEKLLQKNWKETVLSKAKHFERYLCVVKEVPILGYFFVKKDTPIEKNVFLSPDNDSVRTKADFERICAKRAEQHLDRSKPLYELEIFTKFDDEAEQGKTIVLFRVHHVCGDGIGLLTTICNQVEGNDGGTSSILMAPKRKAKIFPLPVLIIIATAFIHKMLMIVFGRADKNVFHDNSKTPTGKRACAFSKPINLKLIKEIRCKHPGTTLNDVLMGAVAGSYHKYMMKRLRHNHPKKTEDELLRMLPSHITANMPINMRPQLEKSEPKLENKFTFLFVRLPVSSPDRVERLNKTRRGLAMLKRSMAPIVHYFVVNKVIMEYLPLSVAERLVTFCGNKCTTLLTNVPGPQGDKLILQGKTIESMAFFVPQRGNCVMGISLMTIYGFLRMGVLVDESHCPDPQTFVKMFEEEIDLLNTPIPSNEEGEVVEELKN
eukprot:TRINITY_DN7543_c0_g1_i1.p1 TRINITY_DN7543_c0_g1~~TRINITY_DN7543_c0_g1_i1.p1  ORF type:complete len:512 (+),score=161.54 TRINITY_DN7543_c0_g1_i1:20-1555(+)